MALYKAGKTVELREVDLKSKPAEMLKASPKGSVPVLILPDGTVIDESFDIMKRALEKDEMEEVFLIKRNDNEFKKALDRYKYPNRYPDEDCSGAQSTCEDILKDLNDRLEKNKYLRGDQITLTDMALFPFVRQCAFVDKDWFNALPMPHLQKWLEAHLDSALFKAVMEKFEVWEQGAVPVFL